MFQITEPPPTPGRAPQTVEPPSAYNHSGNNVASAAPIPFPAGWLLAVARDASLPSEALAVASVMAGSVGIGRVAFTDWQRINAALGRNRMDLAVFETMSELELGGYLDRDADDQFVYGWTLLIPVGKQ